MQTTLLGLAIAIIVALATALAAPLFVDWNRYRGEFEARASGLTGLDIRITGAIDARLLPTPTLVMQGVEIARPGDTGKDSGKDVNRLGARALRLEFELGALARGEWRLRDLIVEGPELRAGIDTAGRLDWSVPKVGFKPDGTTVETYVYRNGLEFQTYYFGPEFSGVFYVEIPNSGWSLDNLVLSVPEPCPATLLAVGALITVAARFRKKK